MDQAFSLQRPDLVFGQETWDRITRLDPSAVSDILHKRGFHNQVMRSDIQAPQPGVRLYGVARTMSSRPLVGAPEPGREYELLFAAVDGLSPGQILVTDRTDCCVWGELCTEAAIRRGGNGIVIDGFTRDTAGICELGFPFFCRGRHMSDLLYHRQISALDEPVTCGDVVVNPGDLILGADDGVLVVPAAEAESVVEEAYQKSQTESQVRIALRQGMTAGEAYRRFGVM